MIKKKKNSLGVCKNVVGNDWRLGENVSSLHTALKYNVKKKQKLKIRYQWIYYVCEWRRHEIKYHIDTN